VTESGSDSGDSGILWVMRPHSRISLRQTGLLSFVVGVALLGVNSDVEKVISLHGKSSTVNITGVHFNNVTVQGKAITSQTDSDASWDINRFVSGITFQ
jgi:hypothetical protein